MESSSASTSLLQERTGGFDRLSFIYLFLFFLGTVPTAIRAGSLRVLYLRVLYAQKDALSLYMPSACKKFWSSCYCSFWDPRLAEGERLAREVFQKGGRQLQMKGGRAREKGRDRNRFGQ